MNDFRRCLEQCDVEGIKKLWAHVAPHLPQPKDDHEALVTIHRARTETKSIAFKMRAYSHRWLVDNGYPSGLADELKPKAERIYPKIVGGVGISVNTSSRILRPIIGHVQSAMEDAVSEAYEDKRTEPSFVKGRMMEAREKTIRKLVGKIYV